MKIVAQYYAVYSGHNFLAWAYCEGWHPEHLARRFATLREAEAFVADMHPDYRRRLKPEVMHCQLYETGEIGVAAVDTATDIIDAVRSMCEDANLYFQ